MKAVCMNDVFLQVFLPPQFISGQGTVKGVYTVVVQVMGLHVPFNQRLNSQVFTLYPPSFLFYQLWSTVFLRIALDLWASNSCNFFFVSTLGFGFATCVKNVFQKIHFFGFFYQ